MVMPFFEQYAEEYKARAYFRTVNIREQPKIAKMFQVSGLPHFKFILKGKVIDSLRGVDPQGKGLLHHIKKAVHKADKAEIKVTKADLLEFFQKHDPEVAASPDSIQMLIDQGSVDYPRMLDMLEGQYNARPRYSGGFIKGAAVVTPAGDLEGAD